MKYVYKLTGNIIAMICFIFGAISLYSAIAPHTVTEDDYFWAEVFGYATVEEYIFWHQIDMLIAAIVLFSIAIAIITYIRHKEKK